MKYFAYGSNMSLPRLRDRVASAERIGAYVCLEHSLRFHKVSVRDGSGKCDALFTGNPNDFVVGALFEISDSDKGILDAVEGLGFGYLDKPVSVIDSRGDVVEAVTYYATHTDASLQPYSWYLHHVIYGARETVVPAGYLEALTTVQSIEDPDKTRDAKERAIYG